MRHWNLEQLADEVVILAVVVDQRHQDRKDDEEDKGHTTDVSYVVPYTVGRVNGDDDVVPEHRAQVLIHLNSDFHLNFIGNDNRDRSHLLEIEGRAIC